MTRRAGNAGFVLVNALIIVAVLAAVSAGLLARSETSRVTLTASQRADQLALYLDAFDAYAITLLTRDALEGPADHPGEAWAQAGVRVPIDRGEVSGDLEDVQGRFNVNWLLDGNRPDARPGFDQLLAARGVSPAVGAAIVDALFTGGIAQRAAHAAMTPPVRPVGGFVQSLDVLAITAALRPEQLEALRPWLTALPPGEPLNINMAHPLVLGAVLTDLSDAQIAALVARRLEEPFKSVQAFADEVGLMLGAPLEDTMPLTAFSVGSRYFEVQSVARLDDGFATRRTQLRREENFVGVSTDWRVTRFP